VEAAGVEPDTRVENTQLTDPANASTAMIPSIAKSAVQTSPEDSGTPLFGLARFAIVHPETLFCIS
jgi:hypothetical protein